MEKVRESYNHHLAAAREKDIKWLPPVAFWQL